MVLISSVPLLSTKHAVLKTKSKMWVAPSRSTSLHVQCCFRREARLNHIQRAIQYKASIITIASTCHVVSEMLVSWRLTIS
jgi:hypothetical protein